MFEISLMMAITLLSTATLIIDMNVILCRWSLGVSTAKRNRMQCLGLTNNDITPIRIHEATCMATLAIYMMCTGYNYSLPNVKKT